MQGKVLETAYRLIAYSYYGGKKTNAVRALKRRCPGWSKGEIEPWLEKGLAVQESATRWLKENEDAMRRQHRRDEPTAAVAESFHKAHPEWPPAALEALLNINFFYFYLK